MKSRIFAITARTAWLCKHIALASVVLCAVASAATTTPAGLTPDLIYHNGRIATLDERSTVVQALAVRDGRIVATGTDADMRALAGPDTKVVNLGGHTVVPGLYDNHVHIGVGRNPNVYDWTKVASAEQLYAVLREAVAKTPEGVWIEAGLSTELMTENLLPTRADLDRIAPRNPVAIERMHVMLVNSLALEKAGITRETPNPPGGMIDRDANGEANGRIREGPAQKLIRAVIPKWEPEPEAARQAIRKTLRGFAAQGLTSVNGGMMRPRYLHLVQDVYERWGHELPRLTMQPRISPGYDTYDDIKEGIAKEIALIEGMSVRTNFGDDRFKLGAIKMSVDGGMTGQAAWLTESYKGRPDYHGVVRIPEEALYAVGKRAHDLGWQLGIHAIGDAAVESTVRVYDRILRESPRSDHRHYIHHWSINPSEETIRKTAELGVIVAIQPNFTHSLAAYYANATEGDKLQRNNPTASLLKRGIRVSYGSDGLPIGPFIGIYGAVTRRATEFSGPTSKQVHGPDERVSVEQALRLYTQATAYMTFDEHDRGVLAPGKLADFVAISEDIFKIDPERIRLVEPLLTVIGGEVVWDAGRPLPGS
jgi:predicted amidohydrolase YtcJ